MELNPTENALIEGFEAGLSALPGEEWAGKRRDAITRFGALGLPHRRVESWKYSDLRGALRKGLPAPGDESAPSDVALPALFSEIERHVVVIADGKFRADLSTLDGLEKGVEILSLDEALGASPDWLRATLGQVNSQNEEAVLALNFALMASGVVIRVGAGVKSAKPVHVAYLSSQAAPTNLAMHSLVVLEDGAALTLFETHDGSGEQAALTNIALEIKLGRAAVLDHVVIQRAAPKATHVSSMMSEVGANAHYRGFVAALGGGFVRQQTFARFAGEGAAFDIAGVTMIAGRQHCDTTVVVDHAVPSCTSDELFKSVVDGRAHAIFQGKVIVAPDAQKTDGRQMTKGLLLSENAAFTAKPELEIFADDVQCAHGATSGQLDKELLFYLRSRGIPEQEAKALLITAFVGEAIEKITHEGAREAVQDLAGRWLYQHGQGENND